MNNSTIKFIDPYFIKPELVDTTLQREDQSSSRHSGFLVKASL
jgi:hypothetical protein